MSPSLSLFYTHWLCEKLPAYHDIAIKGGMATYKRWLHRNYLVVILVCLVLAVLIWWVFHRRIQHIEDQLRESGHKQALLTSAPVHTCIFIVR